MSYRIGLLCLIIALPGTARAAEPDLEDITPDTVYVRGGVLNLAADGNSFFKIDLVLGTDVTILPGRLTGKMELLIGPGFAGFSQSIGDGLSATTEWHGDAFVALLGSGRLTLFRRGRLDVGTRFAYEASLFGANMRPQKFSFKDDSGTYDVSTFAKEHAALSASWSRLAADMDVRYRFFDAWTAYASVGFTRFAFALTISIDDEAEKLVESIGRSPDAIARTYDMAYVVPTVRVGSDVNLPNLPIYLTAEVALVPISIEQLFLGATLGIGLKL